MGDGICSDATGNSSKPLHVGDGIYSNAAADSSCSGAVGNSSYSISSATGDGMYADTTGGGTDFEGSYSGAVGRLLLRP